MVPSLSSRPPLPHLSLIPDRDAGHSLKSLREELDATSMIERGCFENGRTTLHFASQVLAPTSSSSSYHCALCSVPSPQLSLLRGVFILVARGIINRRQKDFFSKNPLDLCTNETIFQFLGTSTSCCCLFSEYFFSFCSGGTRKKLANQSSSKLLSGRKIELYLDVKCHVTWKVNSSVEGQEGVEQNDWISGISSSFCKSLHQPPRCAMRVLTSHRPD
jgi:hypothetical protein